MLNLDYVKNHLNVDKCFNDDDLYIMSLIEVTEQIIIKSLNLDDISTIYDYDKQHLKDGLVQAQLLLIGQYYANRESVSYGNPVKLPLGFEYILQLYKSYDYTNDNN